MLYWNDAVRRSKEPVRAAHIGNGEQSYYIRNIAVDVANRWERSETASGSCASGDVVLN